MEYVPYMLKKLNELGHRANWLTTLIKLKVIFYFYYIEKILKLELNRKNIVIHAINYKERIFSLTWQILMGRIKFQ